MRKIIKLQKMRTATIEDFLGKGVYTGKGYSKNPNSKCHKQVRVGGSKGKEGRSDHTAGKKAFKRPCTTSCKSQNQPIQRGGGNRTPN